MQSDDCKVQSAAKPARSLRHSALCTLHVTFLVCLSWFAHFSCFRQMGFYEDDHWFAARTIAWSTHDLAAWIWDQLRFFPNPQGRPIGFIVGDVIPFVCYRLGGLPAMYLVGGIIFASNTLLVFTLLRRLLIPPLPLIGSIAFVLFPADTTRPFLCHAHILQPSITFTLLACHLQMNPRNSRRWLAYLPALCALLTYETALLPFVVFPLLHEKLNRRGAAAFAIHLLILAILTAGLFSIRRSRGESRVLAADTTRQEVVHKIFTGTGIGLDTVLTVIQSRSRQGFDDYQLDRTRRAMLSTWAIAIGLVVFLSTLQNRPGYLWLFTISCCRATVFCVAGLAIAYVFCFTHYPPFYQEGRLTSTHLGATLPCSVLLALCCCVPIVLLPRFVGGAVTAVLTALYFTSLFAASHDEQVGYTDIWKARQQLWTQIIDLCPDMTDSTLIALDGRVPQPAYYMGTASWSDFLVLPQMFDFSTSHFHRNPMAAYFPRTIDNMPTWQNNITLSPNGTLIWNDSPFGVRSSQPVFDHNLIVLNCDPAGKITRQYGIANIAGNLFHLKDKSNDIRPFPTLPMYGIITGRSD